MSAADLVLGGEERRRLDEAGAWPLPYPYRHPGTTARDRLAAADLALLGPCLWTAGAGHGGCGGSRARATSFVGGRGQYEWRRPPGKPAWFREIPARCAMCSHQPPCPRAERPDREAAQIIAFRPEQGWSLLCNGVIVFDDTGELLPDGRIIAPHRPGQRRQLAAV